MSILRPLILALGAASLLACTVEEDPAAAAARTEANKAARAAVQGTLETHFPAVMDDCLTMLQGGAAPSDAQMLARGWEKTGLGYWRIKLGDRAIDRINMVQITANFTKNGQSCNFTSNAYADLYQLGAVTRSALDRAGFDGVENTRRSSVFAKGDVSITTTVSQYSGVASAVLTRR